MIPLQKLRTENTVLQFRARRELKTSHPGEYDLISMLCKALRTNRGSKNVR